ncbi:MAG: class I SAM-dependent methyltransferase [Actinomycetota bacterium]
MFDRSAHLYDLIYGFKDYEGEARDLLALIRDRNPGASSLLDVACGTGEHLRLLRSSIDRAEGVDIEPQMLAIAQQKLPDMTFTVGDMRSFALERTFDAVTCLFSSIGYMANTAELNDAVANLAAHLAPGGVLVIDGWVRPDAWHPGINVMAQAATAEDSAVARVVRTRRDADRTELEMRYLVATSDGFETATETHVLMLFTHDAYRSAFVAAGLDPEVLPGPMGPDRDRYLAVRGS